MAWITMIDPERAEGRLRTLFDRVRGPDGAVDEILRLHSLRPHTLEGHMSLYKAVLHHSGNQLPKTLLEAIGVYVSHLNSCDYCVAHHAEGLRRLVRDDARADAQLTALARDRPGDAFDAAECAALAHAKMLTRTPHGVTPFDLERLREHGFDDGAILEINQVTAYFAYANRTVLGLGGDARNDVLGLSPGTGGDEDWGHA